MTPPNPILVPDPEPGEPPLAELKKHLILFVDSPPGPKTARAVYDLYRRSWGMDRIRIYASTALGALPRDWSSLTQRRFESVELPDLRRHEDWGYAFSDKQATDSWLFMFHGYAPFSEPDTASFYRFEFDWRIDPGRLFEFATAVLQIVRCVSGYGGYIFQGQPRGPHARSSFDQIYAVARRYWGVEVQDLDVTVKHMLHGYKCPSWLTIIGPRLAAVHPDALTAAAGAAFRAHETPGGTILSAGPAPVLGDRNHLESLERYEAIARALEPLQVKHHDPFGGGDTKWTEDRTMGWLHRFTNPSGFA